MTKSIKKLREEYREKNEEMEEKIKAYFGINDVRTAIVSFGILSAIKELKTLKIDVLATEISRKIGIPKNHAHNIIKHLMPQFFREKMVTKDARVDPLVFEKLEEIYSMVEKIVEEPQQH